MNRLNSENARKGKTLTDSVDPLLTDREICSQLKCARSTWWRWVADGTVQRPLKIGGTSRWRKSTIDALIAEAEAAALAA